MIGLGALMEIENFSEIHFVLIGVCIVLLVLIIKFLGHKNDLSKKKKLLKRHKSFFHQLGKYRSEKLPEKYNWLPLEAIHKSVRIEKVEDVFERTIADHRVIFFETKLRVDSNPFSVRYDHYIDNGFFFHFPETKLQTKNILLCPPIKIPGNLSLFVLYVLSAAALFYYVQYYSKTYVFTFFLAHSVLFYLFNLFSSGKIKFKTGQLTLGRLKHLQRKPVLERFKKYSLVESESNTQSTRWLEALFEIDQRSKLKGIEYLAFVKNGKLTLGIISNYDFFSADRADQQEARRNLEKELSFIETFAANIMREIQGKKL